jgi:2-keto-4-pentenoate hydratase/2-oxohepta-3-ene-1,7-dioic acid hydratase in catechol pathway
VTAEFRLLTYCHDMHPPRAGVLIEDRVLPAATLLEGVDGVDTSSVLTLLRTWDVVHPRLHALARRALPVDGLALEEVRLMAPILYPGTLFCAGANYWDHFEEMAEITRRTTGKAPSMTKPDEPWFFLKTTAGSIKAAPSKRSPAMSSSTTSRRET